MRDDMGDVGKDDFWDLGKLTPKRRTARPVFDTSPVDVESDGAANRAGETARETAARRLSYPTGEPADKTQPASALPFFDSGFSGERLRRETVEVEREYQPAAGLVRQVRVLHLTGGYRYYRAFEEALYQYLPLTVKEAEKVPFFSYVPQYAQLSRSQLSWYLCWRAGCRRGICQPTDFSYLLLYIYELLNIASPKDPERIRDELCTLWRTYRTEYHQLDKYLADWVCDYCLIHGLSCPPAAALPFLPEVLGYASLREFYLGAERGTNERARLLILNASNYHYRKSRFYKKETQDAYETHIPAAIGAAADCAVFLPEETCGEKLVTVKRDAYIGALCSDGARRTLEITYHPLSRSGELRKAVSDAVKYAENCLRASLGIRGRLSVGALDAEARRAIDGYFRSAFGERFSVAGGNRRAGVEQAFNGSGEVGEYERYYESPETEFARERAEEIEVSSWDTARMMADDWQEDEEAPEVISVPTGLSSAFSADGGLPVTEDADDEPVPLLMSRLDPLSRRILRYLCEKDSRGAAKEAASCGRFLGSVCEGINEQALEILGDILTEERDGVFCILEEYEREVMAWITEKTEK